MQHIFIHGLGQGPTSWDRVISFLTESIKPNCPDLSSFAEGKDIVYANLYTAFSKYCDNFSEPLCLCGLSLGGVLALNYAIDNPLKVKSLILIGVQYKMPKTLLKVQNIIFRVMPRSVFKSMGFSKSDIIKLTTSMMDIDFSKELNRISCSALIVCGAKDTANKKAAKELFDNIKGAKLQIIENAGHEVNVDSPEKLSIGIELHLHK